MNSTNPEEILVSIITPVYNSEKYIGDAIRSVISQTHRNWEMIIVDDFSEDRTNEEILAFRDPRIRYYKLDSNSGAVVARNKALDLADGTYIAFLDADDMWKPDKLTKQLFHMIGTNAGFSYTGYEIMRSKKNKMIKVPKTQNYHQFLMSMIIGTLTVMVNRDIVGDFRMVNVQKDHDGMTWAKILREGHLAYGLDESLAYYRKVRGSISNNKFKEAKHHWDNLRVIEKLSLSKSLYYFIFYGVNGFRKHYL